MNYTGELLDEIAMHVTRLFNQFQTDRLSYHNLDHTHTVVERVREIAGNYDLPEESMFVLLAAAWFHDTGHLFGSAAGHEEKSIRVMKSFFENRDADKIPVNLIEKAIEATHYPYKPETILDEIICDADSYHLGTKAFLETDELVKKEFTAGKEYLLEHWDEHTLEMLKEHHYFTDYCITLLKKGKEKNIGITEERIAGIVRE